MMTNPKTKERYSVTVDIKVIDAIEELKNNAKYANRSAITNELLIAGLATKGIELET